LIPFDEKLEDNFFNNMLPNLSGDFIEMNLIEEGKGKKINIHFLDTVYLDEHIKSIEVAN